MTRILLTIVLLLSSSVLWATPQYGRDVSKALAGCAKFANGRQRSLLGRIRIQSLTTAREPKAELDIADSLSVAALMAERITCAFSDRFAFPLAYGSYDCNH